MVPQPKSKPGKEASKSLEAASSASQPTAQGAEEADMAAAGSTAAQKDCLEDRKASKPKDKDGSEDKP
eukprot:249071-Alexandrium_andersonii.AAC.1